MLQKDIFPGLKLKQQVMEIRYISHIQAGYTTVYAHLDRFRKDISDFVRDKAI